MLTIPYLLSFLNATLITALIAPVGIRRVEQENVQSFTERFSKPIPYEILED